MTTPLLLPPGQPAGQPTAPPPLSPGGRTAVRGGLVALAGVLITAVIVSLAGFAWGASRFRVVADTITLPATLRALTVDTGPVPAVIRITTDRDVSEPRVDLRLISPARTDVEPLTLGADGRSARVSVSAEPAPMLRWARGGEITVVLPPQLARGLAVTTEQEMGVVMADADVDQLTARTTDGAVVLNGSARRIDITNDHGDVASRNAISVAEPSPRPETSASTSPRLPPSSTSRPATAMWSSRCPIPARTRSTPAPARGGAPPWSPCRRPGIAKMRRRWSPPARRPGMSWSRRCAEVRSVEDSLGFAQPAQVGAVHGGEEFLLGGLTGEVQPIAHRLGEGALIIGA